MKTWLSMGIAAMALVTLPACSDDDAGGAHATYSVTSCPQKVGTTAACSACLEASCASQVSAANSACADVIACACAPGSDASACPAQSSACDSASLALFSCGVTACPGPCGGGNRDGGATDGG